MQELFGIVGTLVGVIIGGGIIVYANQQTLAHTASREKAKRNLEKLESAHQTLATILQHYRESFSDSLTRISDLPLELTPAKDNPVPFDHLRMLISFYAPHLSGDCDSLIGFCVNSFGHLYGQSFAFRLKRLEGINDSGDGLRDALLGAFSEIEQKVRRLQDALAVAAAALH
jgi:hypothetical protein